MRKIGLFLVDLVAILWAIATEVSADMFALAHHVLTSARGAPRERVADASSQVDIKLAQAR